jgi:outer membrane lipase/esterase
MRVFLSPLIGALFFASAAVSATPFSNMFVFGDSLSDNGNLFAATGGVVPFPDYYDQGRFQNGPNYADYL